MSLREEVQNSKWQLSGAWLMADRAMTGPGQLFKIIALLLLPLGRFAMMAFWNRDGEVWIGSNGRVELSHRNEWHGGNTNLLSSLHQFTAYRNQIRQNCLPITWFKACNAVWTKSPSFWAVTQPRTIVCFRRFGTSCWSHLHRSDNPRRMPGIVWAILLGSFDLWRRDQQNDPKRWYQTTVQRCITAQKSVAFFSYKLGYCFKSLTVVRCWWRVGSY